MSLARPDGQNDIKDALERLIDLINKMLIGGLFHSGVMRDVGFAAANTNVEVNHGLGRVPSIYFSVAQNAAGSIYSDTVHTEPRDFIYLKSSAIASGVRVLIA